MGPCGTVCAPPSKANPNIPAALNCEFRHSESFKCLQKHLFWPKPNMLLLLPSLSILFLATKASASFHDFGIPVSNATVDVKVFNVGNNHLTNATDGFATPVLPGHESFVVPMFSFLVEHNDSQTRLMFDLGIRKDPQNLAPSIGDFYASGFVFLTEESKDITELLQDGGIPLDSIDAVIWR